MAALSFLELYVGAIRLYDLGYRDEAVYWFYSPSAVHGQQAEPVASSPSPEAWAQDSCQPCHMRGILFDRVPVNCHRLNSSGLQSAESRLE